MRWKPILGRPLEPPLLERRRVQTIHGISMRLPSTYVASVAVSNNHRTGKRPATGRTIVSHRSLTAEIMKASRWREVP